jgi:hypothetical protein
MSLLRCSRCVMPNTRPDTPFIDGVCAACLSYARRPQIDWDERKAQLLQLLDRHDGRVLVPSSGGKDSTYQVMTLLELGADVTVVTARTCHLTAIGRANIDNLARYARTIEVVPNMTVRAQLNRLGLELVGDISWPEHAAIFSTPFRVAVETGHTLLMYGENPQDQYGGPLGTEEARTMTRRWVTEFGGFLGLRPSDFIGMEGITQDEMADYEPMPDWMLAPTTSIEAHFLGQYIPWDSRRNAQVAEAAGMSLWQDSPPAPANWWKWENLDNAQTGLHDHFMFLKYGFGRGCQQISVDVRAGNVKREHALAWLDEFEGAFPSIYAGVFLEELLDRIGVDARRLQQLMDQFTNREIHGRP